MLIKKDMFVEREEILEAIQSMMTNLTTIKDETGEFLLEFDGVIVDDKSWSVWNWPQGVGLYGMYKYWKITNDERALKIITDWYDERLNEGAPPKNVNTMAPILTMAFLYEEFKDQRFVPYLEQWAEWAMNDMPRTEQGGLAHMTYEDPHEDQLWDDTLMMTVLPLAKIGMLFDRQDYVEEAKKQFVLHTQYLADKETGLWYHGWTFDGSHNYAEAKWARGNCWVTITIPDVIEILDLKEGDFLRDYLINVLEKQIKTLAKHQNESGLWHTLIEDETSYLESSASAGFAYGIIKSINKRYISSEYKETAEKAVLGLLNEIDDTGAVQKVSVGTGMGDDLDFYKEIGTTTMPYGQSLTILAFAELLVAYV